MHEKVLTGDSNEILSICITYKSHLLFRLNSSSIVYLKQSVFKGTLAFKDAVERVF